MTYLSDLIKERVRSRALNRCEYCRLYQISQVATFHIDHIIPVREGGDDSFENLALACVSCSLHKAAKLRAVDNETGAEVFLFNPGKMDWKEHFLWEGEKLAGKTATGRATIASLKMNKPNLIAIRKEEAFWGRHP